MNLLYYLLLAFTAVFLSCHKDQNSKEFFLPIFNSFFSNSSTRENSVTFGFPSNFRSNIRANGLYAMRSTAITELPPGISVISEEDILPDIPGVPIGELSQKTNGLIALKSIQVGEGSIINSNIYAIGSCRGFFNNNSCAKGRADVFIGNHVSINSESEIKGDKINLGTDTDFDGLVRYNSISIGPHSEITNAIKGVDSLPKLPSFLVGTENTNASFSIENRKLSSGAYGKLYLPSNKTAWLQGGIYQLTSLELGNNSQLICEDYCLVTIEKELRTKAFSKIYSKSNSPNDFLFYVNGKDFKFWFLELENIDMGTSARISASIYAPFSTVVTYPWTKYSGILIAKDIKFSPKTKSNDGDLFRDSSLIANDLIYKVTKVTFITETLNQITINYTGEMRFSEILNGKLAKIINFPIVAAGNYKSIEVSFLEAYAEGEDGSRSKVKILEPNSNVLKIEGTFTLQGGRLTESLVQKGYEFSLYEAIPLEYFHNPKYSVSSIKSLDINSESLISGLDKNTYDSMIEEADFIGTGKIANVTSYWEPFLGVNLIFSDASYTITKEFKDSADNIDSSITVKVLGGRMGDTIQSSPHYPAYVQGSTDLIFVKKRSNKNYVVNGNFGKVSND